MFSLVKRFVLCQREKKVTEDKRAALKESQYYPAKETLQSESNIELQSFDQPVKAYQKIVKPSKEVQQAVELTKENQSCFKRKAVELTKENLSAVEPTKEQQSPFQTTIKQQSSFQSAMKTLHTMQKKDQCKHNVIESKPMEGMVIKTPRDNEAHRRTVNRLLRELKNESIHVATLVDENGRIFFSIEMTDLIRNDGEMNNIANMVQEILQDSLERLMVDEAKRKERRFREKENDEIAVKLKRHLVFESKKKNELIANVSQMVKNQGTQMSAPLCSWKKATGSRERHREYSPESMVYLDDKYLRKSSIESLKLQRIGSGFACTSNEEELRTLLYSYILSHLDKDDIIKDETPIKIEEIQEYIEEEEKSHAPTESRTNESRTRNTSKFHVRVPFLKRDSEFVKCEVYLKQRKEVLKKKLEKKKGPRKRSDSYISDLMAPRAPDDVILKFKTERFHQRNSRDVKRSLLRLKKHIERKLRRSKQNEEKKRKNIEEDRRWEEKCEEILEHSLSPRRREIKVNSNGPAYRGRSKSKKSPSRNRSITRSNHKLRRKEVTETTGNRRSEQFNKEHTYPKRLKLKRNKNTKKNKSDAKDNKIVKTKTRDSVSDIGKCKERLKESHKARKAQDEDTHYKIANKTEYPNQRDPKVLQHPDDTIRDNPSSEFVRMTEYISTSEKEVNRALSSDRLKSRDQERRPTTTKRPVRCKSSSTSSSSSETETCQTCKKKIVYNKAEYNQFGSEHFTKKETSLEKQEHVGSENGMGSTESPEKLIAVTFFGSGMTQSQNV